MQICEATVKRIRELLKRDRLTLYALSYKTGMPLSTLKCILNGRSKNPGIVNIQKIAEGFNMSIREFYSCDLFDNLEQEDFAAASYMVSGAETGSKRFVRETSGKNIKNRSGKIYVFIV